jgi:hypothetical protein
LSDIIVEEESRLVVETTVVNISVDCSYGNDDVSIWLSGDLDVY